VERKEIPSVARTTNGNRTSFEPNEAFGSAFLNKFATGDGAFFDGMGGLFQGNIFYNYGITHKITFNVYNRDSKARKFSYFMHASSASYYYKWDCTIGNGLQTHEGKFRNINAGTDRIFDQSIPPDTVATFTIHTTMMTFGVATLINGFIIDSVSEPGEILDW
jgi:hypothetical protein